jgi:catechol 2,3-dioxygenase-like lactoylglutathione lyase family enzyme
MLRDIDATPMLAVKDIEAAKDFYGGILGLEPARTDQGEGMILYRSGATTFLVYESEHAGTNEANALAWSVGEAFDSIVEDLRTQGVMFEHYELPGLRLEGDVHVAENFKAVWFKDPDGNILHINR